jgi:hypothetical protein
MLLFCHRSQPLRDGLLMATCSPGTRERHLEALLQSTLRQIILVTNFPRTLIQITLQVTVAPENEYANTKVAQASTVRRDPGGPGSTIHGSNVLPMRPIRRWL